MRDPKAIDAIKAKLPAKIWRESEADMAGYLSEWRDRWRGTTPLLIEPTSTAQVAQIVSICHRYQYPITVQGGNTGLVGGQIPQGDILLSTRRLTAIRSVSKANMSMVCDAGVSLAHVQQAALDVGLKFPLSLASEGSCTIGGNLSTNAGGVHVIKYGTARALCLGVEAVMADGTIFNGLSPLRKDNTGYDLSQVFIGAEGTLAILTAASLKLFPQPTHTIRAFIAMDSVQAAINLLEAAQSLPNLSMFELIPHLGLDAVLDMQSGAGLKDPFRATHPWYGLLEWEFFNTHPDAQALETLLGRALSDGNIVDAVIAKNEAESARLLALRENLSAAQKALGASIKHDVSVPVSHIADFIQAANSAITQAVPASRPLPFGHMGDGNIHYNISQPPDMDADKFMKTEPMLNEIVYDLVAKFGGSISAEHGIGILKKQDLASRADPVKMQTIRTLKTALDPHNILNPRVLLS